MTSISKPASAVRPGDTITRHPDYPDRRVRFRVTRGARNTSVNAVLIDYTAPADEIAGLIPNDRAKGILFLGPDQPCEVEPALTTPVSAPRAERTQP